MDRIGLTAHENMDEEGRQLFVALGLDSERTIRRSDGPGNWFWVYCPNAKVCVWRGFPLSYLLAR